MAGLFKKMYRYFVKCGFCGKPTDVMAFDPDDAGKRLTEKGWRNMKISQGHGKKKKEAVVLACPRCSDGLLKAQADANLKMSQQKNEVTK